MEINKNQPAIKRFINEEAQMKREIIEFFPPLLSLMIFLSKGSWCCSLRGRLKYHKGCESIGKKLFSKHIHTGILYREKGAESSSKPQDMMVQEKMQSKCISSDLNFQNFIEILENFLNVLNQVDDRKKTGWK